MVFGKVVITIGAENFHTQGFRMSLETWGFTVVDIYLKKSLFQTETLMFPLEAVYMHIY